MEFKIQRYEEKEDDVHSGEQVDLFQKRIEERRLKRKSCKLEVPADGSSAAEPTKRKRNKDNNEIETDRVSTGECTDPDPTLKTKNKEKKKKKKKKCSDNEAPVEQAESLADKVETGGTHGGVKKKKKKKLVDTTESTTENEQMDEEVENDETIGSNMEGKTNKNDETIEVQNGAEVMKNGNDIEGENNEENVPETENLVPPDEGNVDTIEDDSSSSFFPILGKHSKSKKTVSKRTLPRWLSEPVFIPADINSAKISIEAVDYLPDNTLKNLKTNNIEYLFPVQAHIINRMTSQNKIAVSRLPPRDLCVQAPTGSGKTLAYVLPTIHVLSKFLVRQLYCLVVVPSKDLAVQVYKVFETYTVGTELKAGVASGLKTFSKEQEKLVGKNGCSKIDILVCTPGRLVDHLKQTPGFSLRHLRFLVVDEADRLLGQDYSSWLEEVKTSVYASAPGLMSRRKLTPINPSKMKMCQLPFQKLLFSATLTQNPEKIAPLELFHPLLFTSKSDHLPVVESEQMGEADSVDTENERFVIPGKLDEKMVVVDIDVKPLVLVYLMVDLGWKGVLCFTKSIESTHRLRVLMQGFSGFSVAEFSSNFSETQRKGIIRDFNSGKVDLLISSDAMARGMDIDTVKLVVNYDTAGNAKTYVHRVGRTARAGKEGSAVTILSSKEVYHFKLMMKKMSRDKIPKMVIPERTLESYQDKYTKALSNLQETIALEHKTASRGNLKT